MSMLLALALNTFISTFARSRRSLSPSGAWAAFLLGLGIWFFGGPLLWVSMLGFFASSSLLTAYSRRRRGSQLADQAEGEGRNHLQVLANGGVSLFFAVLFSLTGHKLYLLAGVTAFAAANADTWASEIGVLSRRPPVSIITRQALAPGLSGGVSPLGTFAALLGALLIGIIFALGLLLAPDLGWPSLPSLALVTAGGFIGSLLDSLLGATLQAKFYSKSHRLVVERPVYLGEATELISGWAFVTNDLVNLCSMLLSGLLVVGIGI